MRTNIKSQIRRNIAVGFFCLTQHKVAPQSGKGLLVLPVLGLFLFVFTCWADPVAIARTEIGHGEIGGNNKGKYVRLYNKGLESSWCAGFVSYVLKKSGEGTLGYTLSARKMYNKGNKVTVPKAGDLICFWRGNKNSWKGHIGIIEEVNDKEIITIEGNVGPYPAKVKRVKYNRNKIPKLLGFIRL